jgi:hypothetical protein
MPPLADIKIGESATDRLSKAFGAASKNLFTNRSKICKPTGFQKIWA